MIPALDLIRLCTLIMLGWENSNFMLCSSKTFFWHVKARCAPFESIATGFTRNRRSGKFKIPMWLVNPVQCITSMEPLTQLYFRTCMLNMCGVRTHKQNVPSCHFVSDNTAACTVSQLSSHGTGDALSCVCNMCTQKKSKHIFKEHNATGLMYQTGFCVSQM